MAHDLAESLRETIRQYKAAIASMEETLRKVNGIEPNGLIRKPTTWKTADGIERILEFGAKTMNRAALIKIMVDRKLVGGADDPQRYQYANEAIRRGLEYKYLKEDGDTTIHWVPGVRKSRVRKKL
jgi:hypothetical protein